MHQKHIELNRRFCELTKESSSEGLGFNSYAYSFREDKGLSWDQLLSKKCTVILGEPGSGKTIELTEQAEKVRKSGKQAFFVRLDELVTQSINIALDPADTASFQQWLKGNQQATFFLDSVDEAKLKDYEAFSIALKKLLEAIKPTRLSRSQFIISSRITEWRGHTDRDLLARTLCASNSTDIGEDDSQPYIVELLPLTKPQVGLFVSGKNLPQPDRFLKDLDTHNAWHFAGRPIDVEHLISYWQRYGGLSSLSDLIEFDIEKKLQETTDRSVHGASLSPEQYRKGSEFLAAAVTFCQQPFIYVPDESYAAQLDDTITAVKCLPENWNLPKARALLNRAIFDGAAYGRIRFHHRSISEYLCASWLNSRMKDGCPYPDIENILFKSYGEKRIPKQGLESVLGWMALGSDIWNRRIRNKLKEFAPEVLLQHGDPESLPTPFKQELLRSIVSRYEGRKRAFFHVDITGLQRFAHPDLSPIINQLLLSSETPIDIKADLLNMISSKKLEGCMESALQVATSHESEEYLQSYAIDAVGESETNSHLTKLANHVDTLAEIPPRICSHLCLALYPRIYSAGRLIKLLRKTTPPPSRSVDLEYYLRNLLQSDAPPEHLEPLLNGMIELASEPPLLIKNNKQLQISSNFNWLGESVGLLVYLILTKSKPSDINYLLLSQALRLFSDSQQTEHYHHLPDDFQATVNSHTKLKCEFARLRIDEWLAKKDAQKDIPSSFEIFDYYSILKEAENDIEWIIKDIQKETSPVHRRILMNIAIDIWYRFGRKSSMRTKIKSVTRTDKQLNKEFRNKTRHRPFSRFKWSLQRVLNKHNWWSVKRTFNKKYNHARDLVWMHWHLNQLTSGTATYALWCLACDAREKNSSPDKYSAVSWKLLIPKFGKRIASAVKDGWISVWENYIPLLPHEKPVPHETDNRVVIGLSGIQAAIEEQSINFSTLSSEEAKLACRYAVNEINGLPWWFSELVSSHPIAVKELLTECIHGEWKFDKDLKSAYEVIYTISYNIDLIGDLASPTLMSKLEGAEPDNDMILEYTLKTLLKNKVSHLQRLASLSAIRCKEYDHTSSRFMLWLSTWIQIDAISALNFLDFKLPIIDDADKLVIKLCSHLGSRNNVGPLQIISPDYLHPIHLKRLIPIIYQHIRLEDDINRSGGGAYHPDTRDNAQDFRDSLLQKLAESKDSIADEILSELSEAPILSTKREWILHLLDQRPLLFSVANKWNPEDIVKFHARYAIDPKSDHDLFTVACYCLQNIKDEVEKGDISSREDMNESSDEASLRTWLARQLRQNSREQFKVPQEEEIDLEQRPDLRIEKPGLNPVSVEMKIADNWSPSELISSIKDQLAGQYLRSTNSNYGIFFVGYIGRKAYWKHPTTKVHLDIIELVSLLKEETATFIKDNRGIDGLEIVGIDFTDPKSHK